MGVEVGGNNTLPTNLDVSELAAPNVIQQEKIATLQPRTQTVTGLYQDGMSDTKGRSGRGVAQDKVMLYRQRLEEQAGQPEKQRVLVRRGALPSSVSDEALMSSSATFDAVTQGGAVVAGATPLPGGLASLDIEIPTRGVCYSFTTARGEVELTARAVNRLFIEKLKQSGVVVVLVLVAWQVYRVVRREGFADRYGRRGWIALILLGVISILTGVLPVAGLLAVLIGTWLRVRQTRAWQSVAQLAG
jgi:hypothetical protein